MSASTMTLAFEVNALEQLADPATVFEEAREWSAYVGVISDQMGYQVVNYLRDVGIYNEDFFSRADKEKSLRHVREQTETDRHVFLGKSDEDERLADQADWEYLPIDEAAEKADWELAVDPVRQ